ncbi:MAG TPA: hypothetical protein VFI29_20560 [Hanamia sp.]|nr:hypothetical protein [Hanamia sp.]
MKKFLIVVIILFILLLAGVYIFVPRKLEIAKVDYASCNINGASRTIHDSHGWWKWWPGEEDSLSHSKKTDSVWYYYNGYTYHLNEKLYDAIDIQIKNKSTTIESNIQIFKMNFDSVAIVWKCNLPTGINPVTRILKYKQAEKIRNNMAKILSGLVSFLDNKDNIYGIHLHIVMSKDTTMVATKEVSQSYPSTSDIYTLIGNLKKYIKKEGARENNFPMLNVRKLENSKFETMVAIPTNKHLSGNGKIFFSRFVPWKVLTAEVHGGNLRVEEAMRQMKLYMSDYLVTAMAIPFESLVTDRSKEPDTLKWITRIYTPVP